MNFFNKRIEAVKLVLSNKKYVSLFIYLVLFIYSINVIILYWKSFVAVSYYGIKPLLNLYIMRAFTKFHGQGINFWDTGTIVLSIMSSFMITLFCYRIFSVKTVKKTGFFGIITGFLSICLSPSCPFCTTGIIAIAGTSTVLGFMPYGGAEIPWIGVGIMSISLIITTGTLHNCTKCEEHIH